MQIVGKFWENFENILRKFWWKFYGKFEFLFYFYFGKFVTKIDPEITPFSTTFFRFRGVSPSPWLRPCPQENRNKGKSLYHFMYTLLDKISLYFCKTIGLIYFMEKNLIIKCEMTWPFNMAYKTIIFKIMQNLSDLYQGHHGLILERLIKE